MEPQLPRQPHRGNLDAFALRRRFAELAEQGTEPHLSVRASAWRSSIICGEPVILSLSISNRTSAPIAIHAMFEPEQGYTTVMVQTPSGRTQIIHPMAIKDVADPARMMLAGGETVSTSLSILHGRIWDGKELRNGSAFQEPGAYEVLISYQTKYAAPPVVVEARLPANEVERKARLLLGRQDIQRLVQGKHSSALATDLEGVLSSTQGTPYYAHTLFGAAEHLLVRQDYAECAEKAGLFISTFPDSPQVLRVKLSRATALAYSGEKQAGIAELEELSVMFPKHSVGRMAGSRRDRLGN